MISFKIPKKDIQEIILTFSKQNNLPQHLEEQLVIMITESEYEDFIEIAKREKERTEFENEYQQIISESIDKNNKENFDKKRSKSDFVENKTNNKSFDNQINSNNNEHDYEFIDKFEFLNNNDFKKNRSQSFLENSNNKNILDKNVEGKFRKSNLFLIFS